MNKHCEHCGKPLSRRDDEQLARWKRRMFCNRGCSDPGRYLRASKEAEERFMSFVMPEPMSGCWLWTGHLTRGNYASFSMHAKSIRASRWSYQNLKGGVPKAIPEGMVVRHSCDNPYCVNPDHLNIGTHQDNVDDKVRRGRVPMGENSSTAKLTTAEATKVISDPRKYAEIAADYGISTASVCLIKKGKNWAHLQQTSTRGGL